MKRMTIILLVAAGSMAAFAQPPPAAPQSTTQQPTTPQPGTPQPVTPLPTTQQPTAQQPAAPVAPKKENAQILDQVHTSLVFPPSGPVYVNQKVERVDGMSSKPWAQIVGWNPGYSAFPRPELRDHSMPVFWIGHEPWHE
jgi:hypothetical protein